MIDEEYFSLENQFKRIEANKILAENKKRYKKLLKDSEFYLQPKWHLDKNKINFSHLKSDCHKDLNDKNDYKIYLIDKSELFNILDESFKRVYIKSKIWKNHNDDKITRVIENWENNIKLIPPIIILDLSETKFLIQDGKHRFAVTNYYDANRIPIIILNTIETRFLEIVDNTKVEIVK